MRQGSGASGGVQNVGQSLIRPARAGDSAALSRLIAQLGYEAHARDVGERLAAIEAEGRMVLVAEQEGTVVGCLSTSVMDEDSE